MNYAAAAIAKGYTEASSQFSLCQLVTLCLYMALGSNTFSQNVYLF